MKTKLTALLLVTTALGLLPCVVLAQTPPPSAGTAPPPVVAPLMQAQPTFDPSQLPAIRGTLKYFTLTPRGDVDGFVLADGTQVHVPPHLSTQLVAAVRLGDAVTVHGLRAAALPMVAAMSVTDDASGQTVVDMGPPGGPGRGPRGGPDRGPGAPPPGGPGPAGMALPPPPGGPAAGPPSEVSGKVLTVLHGPRGEVNGAMLEDGTVLRMPPPEAARLATMLAPGQMVVARGPGIANNLGRMVDVRAIGASRDQLTQIQAPPPPRGLGGPGGDRRGPPPPSPGGPGAPPPPGAAPPPVGGPGAPPPPPGGPDVPPPPPLSDPGAPPPPPAGVASPSAPGTAQAPRP